MTKFYTTSDYFRDNFWFLDSVVEIINKVRRVFGKMAKSLVNNDLDSHVFRVLGNIPYGIAIFFLGFLLIVALLRATESANGIMVTSIYTNSMSPVIKPGSMVFSIPQSTYHKGDIVAYNEKSSKSGGYTGRILLHRIIEVKIEENNTKAFVTKGDNNQNPDAGNPKLEDILGKTFVIIPYFGYIDFLTRTIPGFLIFIVAPAILLIKEAARDLRS